MKPYSPPPTVAHQRSSLVSAINRVLALACCRKDGAITDAMVYGSAFQRPEVFGVDWLPGNDSCGFTLVVCSHACDMIVAMRQADPRIGIFLPNAMLDDLRSSDADLSDPASFLLGASPADAQRIDDRINTLMLSGFGAYPQTGGCFPWVLVRRHGHGVFVEYCLGDPVRSTIDRALRGESPIEQAADALAHAAIHILQVIGSHVHAAQNRNRSQRGMTERIEFRHSRTSTDLIRNYNLDPTRLEVVRNACDGQPGEYVFLLYSKERESMTDFLSDVMDFEQQILDEPPVSEARHLNNT